MKKERGEKKLRERSLATSVGILSRQRPPSEKCLGSAAVVVVNEASFEGRCFSSRDAF